MSDDATIRKETKNEIDVWEVPSSLRELVGHSFEPVAGIYIGDDFRKLDRLVLKELASHLRYSWLPTGVHRIGNFVSHYSFEDRKGHFLIFFLDDVRLKKSDADFAVNLRVQASRSDDPKDVYGDWHYVSIRDIWGYGDAGCHLGLTFE